MVKGLALFLVAGLGLSQDPAVIRVPVRVVLVPTAVTSPEGKFVRGIQVSEFRLFDNERIQKFHLDFADEALSLAILVQANDAVKTWLPEVRRAASTLEALMIGENGEASVTQFSDEIKLLQSMTSDNTEVDKALAAIRPTGTKGRCMDAIAAAVDQLGMLPAERKRVILVIAQSGDTGSTADLRANLSALELSNTAIFALTLPHVGKALVGKTVAVRGLPGDAGFKIGVDLGKLVPEVFRGVKASSGEDDLSVLIAEMGGREIPFRNLRELERGIGALGEELHTEYVLRYSPDSAETGYHRIRVELSRPGLQTRFRPGYFVAP